MNLSTKKRNDGKRGFENSVTSFMDDPLGLNQTGEILSLLQFSS